MPELPEVEAVAQTLRPYEFRWACSLGPLLLLVLWPTYGHAQLKTTGLTKADRNQWSRILKIPNACEEAFANTEGQRGDHSGLEFHRLSDGAFLIYAECYPGAYQPGFVLLRFKELPARSAELLKLAGFDSEDDDGHPLQYSMIDGLQSYDPRTATLEIFSKSRGMGDCGQFARYRYTRAKFKLIELREQGCNQTGDLGSTDYRHWPLIPSRHGQDHP
jgi:hypothetical protein